MFRKVLILFLFAFSVFAEYNPNVCEEFSNLLITNTSNRLYDVKPINDDEYLNNLTEISFIHGFPPSTYIGISMKLKNYDCSPDTFCFSETGISIFEEILSNTINFITSKNCNLNMNTPVIINNKTLDLSQLIIDETKISNGLNYRKPKILLKQNIQFNRDNTKDYFQISFQCNKGTNPAYIPFSVSDLKTYLKNKVNWNYKQLKLEKAISSIINQEKIDEETTPSAKEVIYDKLLRCSNVIKYARNYYQGNYLKTYPINYTEELLENIVNLSN